MINYSQYSTYLIKTVTNVTIKCKICLPFNLILLSKYFLYKPVINVIVISKKLYNINESYYSFKEDS